MRPKFQRFGTFNCQGLNDKVKQTHIADDFYKFRLAVIMVQETRIKETGLHEFTSSDGKKVHVSEMEKQLVIRKYAKNKVNENGNLLIEFCKLRNLLITNTIFKYKPSHQTTWISPLPPTFPRKNSYRNQIDYILLRKNMNSKISDSRSFKSNFTRSDQKQVIAKIQIKWTHTKKATGTRSFNLSKLHSTQVAENYMKQVNEIITNQASTLSNQEEWNNIIKALKASAEKNLGYNHKEKKK